MKKYIIYLVSVCFLLLSFNLEGQTQLYVHPDAASYAKDTETFALLPLAVEVKLRPWQMKKLSAEQLEQMGKDESLYVQKEMYAWFIKRKQRGKFSKKVQTPERTNQLLKKAGIDIHNISEYKPSELGKILGVDCIVTGSLKTSKPMSDEVNLAIAGIFRIFTGIFVFGPTNAVLCNINFYNTRDDKLVVNYLKNIGRSLGSDPQDLIYILMRKVTRRIPYTKKL